MLCLHLGNSNQRAYVWFLKKVNEGLSCLHGTYTPNVSLGSPTHFKREDSWNKKTLKED